MEISPTIQYLSSNQNLSVEVLITGVGLMTSTYALTKAVSLHQPGLIIQAGIAGSFSSQLALTQVVAVKAEVVGDLGVQTAEGFQSLLNLNLLNGDIYPWQKGQLLNDDQHLNETGLPLVTGVTINEISTSRERMAYYTHTLGAEIETMEGAALHYVGLMEKVPFIQLRAISNFVGERDKSKWEINKAIGQLNSQLQQLLSKDFIQ
jgi:futalosine hydrolase